MTHETFELMLKLVEAGSAGLVAVALIFVVIVILGHSRKEAAAERKARAQESERDRIAHSNEVGRLLAVHEAASTKIADAVTNAAEAMRELRDEILWERNQHRETGV